MRAGLAPSGSEVTVGSIPKTTQWTQVILGARGSGASGSSTMRARLLVPAGSPDHARGGEVSWPSHVYFAGISPSFAKLGDVMRNVMAAPPWRARQASPA